MENVCPRDPDQRCTSMLSTPSFEEQPHDRLYLSIYLSIYRGCPAEQMLEDISIADPVEKRCVNIFPSFVVAHICRLLHSPGSQNKVN